MMYNRDLIVKLLPIICKSGASPCHNFKKIYKNVLIREENIPRPEWPADYNLGKNKLKVVPFFSSERTSMEPLWTCTILKVAASPKPIPLRLDVK